MEELRVHSIFESISGEAGGFPQGTWCTFIRLQGCNLRCKWCDTVPSQNIGEGTRMYPEEIVAACGDQKYILITGGEPLVQSKALVPLLKLLLKQGRQVQIETNGSLEIPPRFFDELPFVRPPIFWVMDYKCPSSGMSDKMPWIPALIKQIVNARKQGDLVYLKWVVADKNDLDFALFRIRQLRGGGDHTKHLISPLDGGGDKLTEIAEAIERENADLLNHIIFSIQLHKIFGLP